MRSDRCMKEVWCDGVFRVRQCSRKIWKDGYCKQHHPEAVAQRREESKRKQQEKIERDPLVVARKRIAELERECENRMYHIKKLGEIADRHDTRRRKLEAENERLRELHHQIYEVWAGSEGLVASTASEAYQMRLIEEMRDLAAEGKVGGK